MSELDLFDHDMAVGPVSFDFHIQLDSGRGCALRRPGHVS